MRVCFFSILFSRNWSYFPWIVRVLDNEFPEQFSLLLAVPRLYSYRFEKRRPRVAYFFLGLGKGCVFLSLSSDAEIFSRRKKKAFNDKSLLPFRVSTWTVTRTSRIRKETTSRYFSTERENEGDVLSIDREIRGTFEIIFFFGFKTCSTEDPDHPYNVM